MDFRKVRSAMVAVFLLLSACVGHSNDEYNAKMAQYAAESSALNEGIAKENKAEVDKTMAGRVPPDYRLLIDAYMIRHLKDPDSRKVTYGAPAGGGLACGTYNAKNSFGGYVGEEPYIARFDTSGNLYQLDLLDADGMQAIAAATEQSAIMWPYRALLEKCGIAG